MWKEITDSVNVRAGGQKKRSVEQIKEKWRKVCSTAKLEAEVNSKSLNQTVEGPALPAPSEVTQKIIELHTDALKTYQNRKGIVFYIFSVLSRTLISVMDIPSIFILHYLKNTGTFIKQNNECMLYPFLANYIHPFKIWKYGIQIHYFKDIC